MERRDILKVGGGLGIGTIAGAGGYMILSNNPNADAILNAYNSGYDNYQKAESQASTGSDQGSAQLLEQAAESYKSAAEDFATAESEAKKEKVVNYCQSAERKAELNAAGSSAAANGNETEALQHGRNAAEYEVASPSEVESAVNSFL